MKGLNIGIMHTLVNPVVTINDKVGVKGEYISRTHYENLPMHLVVKKLKFQLEFFLYIFLIYARNSDCGYTLEPPGRGAYNMFWSKNKKYRYTPAYPSLFS